MKWRLPLISLQLWWNLCQIYWCRQDLDEWRMPSGRTLPSQWQSNLVSKSSLAAHSSPHYCRVSLNKSCAIEKILSIFLSLKICCRYWNRSALVMMSSSPTSTRHQTFANAWTPTRKCWIIWLSRVAWIWQRLMTLNTFTTRSLMKYIPFQIKSIDEQWSLMNLFAGSFQQDAARVD